MDDRELFERYKKDIYKYCLYMTGHIADAEDICQEVFVKAILAKRESIENEKAWLMRIAANECYSLLKRRKNGSNKEKKAFWLTMPLLSNKSVEKQIELQEMQDEFAALINQLPVRLREVLLLYYLAEWNTAEIADILQIPLGTVKSRLSRALKKLRKLAVHMPSEYKKGSDIHVKMG